MQARRQQLRVPHLNNRSSPHRNSTASKRTTNTAPSSVQAEFPPLPQTVSTKATKGGSRRETGTSNEAEQLDFLQGLFEGLQLSRLQTALKENDNDVERTVESLLKRLDEEDDDDKVATGTAEGGLSARKAGQRASEISGHHRNKVVDPVEGAKLMLKEYLDKGPMDFVEFLKDEFPNYDEETLDQMIEEKEYDLLKVVQAILEAEQREFVVVTSRAKKHSAKSSAGLPTTSQPTDDLPDEASVAFWPSGRELKSLYTSSAEHSPKEWAVLQDNAKKLHSLFPHLGMDQIKSVLHKNGSNMQATAEELLRNAPSPSASPGSSASSSPSPFSSQSRGQSSSESRPKQLKTSPSNSSIEDDVDAEQLSMLSEMFPNRSKADIRLAFELSGNSDMEGVVDYLSAMDCAFEGAEDDADMLDELMSVGSSSSFGSSDNGSVGGFKKQGKKKGKKRDFHSTSSTTVRLGSSLAGGSAGFGATGGDGGAVVFSSAGTGTDVLSKDFSWYRERAQDAHNNRNELFRQACQAYRRGNLTGRGSAAYYSQEGQAMTREMQRLNMMAAERIMQSNRQRFENGVFVLDLHYLTVSEARAFIEEAVTDWYHRQPVSTDSIAGRTVKNPLKIITGVGNHSSGGKAKLYPAVFAMLRRNGWRVEHGGNGWMWVKGVDKRALN
ncbi:hypothetical protein HK102_009229 [Quaeritorhiza haematococci]|nr:hypothetical protein HK102_009229 [Quaeritorhiza haematococci]